MSASVVSSIWTEVTASKPENKALSKALSEGKVAGKNLLVYDELEVALLRALGDKGVIPILSNW